MRASVSMRVETVWANQIEMTVEADLDNPHLPTNRQVATSMVSMLQTIVEEVRSENERYLLMVAESDRADVMSEARVESDRAHETGGAH